ncbi:MAG: hypothetical protein KBG28_27575 [Kofleriaceae bacterium]|jgi:hypothetical protein|nr:hypothetical protein [Kofleriaceae bacterium]MBP6837601.1 hypothetical protein [Kofleriaceae bacterium]MBP9207755.1 hypothetical protein [Kofleriaceae bacterium]
MWQRAGQGLAAAMAWVAMVGAGCGRVDFDTTGDGGGGALALDLAQESVNLSSELEVRPRGGVPPYLFRSTGRGEIDGVGRFLAANRPGPATITVADQTGAEVSATVQVGGASLLLLGGEASGIPIESVLRSGDGRAWSPGGDLPSPRRSGRAVVLRDRLYYLGGQDLTSFHDDVWSSADGVSWTRVGALPRRMASFGLTVHQGELWIAGGYDQPGTDLDLVAHSRDGAAWTMAPPIPTGGRHSVGLISDGEDLYAVGGHGAPGFLDDVLVLRGGATSWEVRPGSLPDTADWGISTTLADRALYSVAGLLMGSPDLVTWTVATTLPSGMLEPAMVDFAGELLVLGGSDVGLSSRDGQAFTSIPGLADGRVFSTVVQFTPP